MEYGPGERDELTPAQLQHLRELSSHPLSWAETFLIEPKTGERFRANYVQRRILSARARDVWVCTHRRGGKCVSGDVRIIHPKSLRPTAIENCRDVDSAFVFSFSENRVVRAPAQYVESGEKLCLLIKFCSGVETTLSADHLLFESKTGWVPAVELKPGDRVLAPTTLSVFGDLDPSDEELGGLVEGLLTTSCLHDDTFRLSEKSLIRFFTSLWREAGRFHRTEDVVCLHAPSPEVAIDLRHLALRLGVNFNIGDGKVLWMSDSIDVRQFLRMVGAPVEILDVKSPRRWEDILSITVSGIRPVYDLVVDHPDHNFIADDIVVHNSYSLCILVLWNAVRFPNSDIVVFAPSQKQVDELFGLIDKWIDANDFLQALRGRVGSHKHPQQRTFETGSVIRGFPLGISSNISEGLRGLSPTYIVVDEAQLLDDTDWDVLDPMMRGDQYNRDKIRTISVGTYERSSGKFYQMIYGRGELPPGAERIFIPITENRDEYFTPERIDQLYCEVGDYRRWEKEYLLKPVGGDTSVFRHEDVEWAFSGDYEYSLEEAIALAPRSSSPSQPPLSPGHSYSSSPSLVGVDLFIGVDWDKVSTGTNILVLAYDPNLRTGRVVWREEVPRSEFTYLEAIKRVIELNDLLSPKLILVDHGVGQVQYELLQATAYRESPALLGKVVSVSYSSTVVVLDPATGEEVKKRLKPFLVGYLQRVFEDRRIVFPKSDSVAKEQFLNYSVVRTTPRTQVYSRRNEHIVDCLAFCYYGVFLSYSDPLKPSRDEGRGSLTVGPPSEEFDLMSQAHALEMLWKSTMSSSGQVDIEWLRSVRKVPRSNF